MVRVLSKPAYPTVGATPVETLGRLGILCTLPGHVFWADDVSLAHALSDSMRGRFQGHHQATEFYLVDLAATHGGKLATFDGSLARSVGSAAAAAIGLLHD